MGISFGDFEKISIGIDSLATFMLFKSSKIYPHVRNPDPPRDVHKTTGGGGTPVLGIAIFVLHPHVRIDFYMARKRMLFSVMAHHSFSFSLLPHHVFHLHVFTR